MPFSNRVLKEYCVCFSTPLSVEIVPLPSFNPPCHTAEPLRCIVFLLFSVFVRWNTGNSIHGRAGRIYLRVRAEVLPRLDPPAAAAFAADKWLMLWLTR